MDRVPQMASISDLRNRHLEVLKRLNNGPVVLATRNEPTAVLVSVNDWDRIVEDAGRYRRTVLLNQLAEDEDPQAWGTMDELDQGLRQRGLLNG